MTTEAGVRLLAIHRHHGTSRERFTEESLRQLIAAIEAEARNDADALENASGYADGVAAERARIRVAVEGLAAKPSGEVVTGTCYQHQQWGCVTCRPVQWVPDGDATTSRTAVLRIIEGATP